MVGASGILLTLWLLGGRVGPLPSPDPPTTQLERTIQLEIIALQSGDQEIYRQFQDLPWRRSNMQPPLDAWSADEGESGLAGEIELVDVHLIDDTYAWAEVRLTWDDTPFKLAWFYRQEEGRWRHEDYHEVDAGPMERLTTPHVQISYNAMYEDEAAELVAILETLNQDLCQFSPCPAEPFRTTLAFDRYAIGYYASENSPMNYQLPAPLRIRWPADGRPEPLVLASTSRHMAYDLLARPYLEQVSRENQTALTLSTFWLAHHLLGLEPPPTTHWLEEATRRDGLPAAAAFVQALTEDTPPQLALRSTFEPGTVSSVITLPDYFGWLVLVMDPENLLRPGPAAQSTYPLPWYTYLQTRLDLMADPWAARSRTYGRAVPEISDVLYREGWAIATPREGSTWGMAYFFRPDDSGWSLSRPDETLMGEGRSAREGPFVITYWAWDEAHLPELMQDLNETYQTVSANLGLKPAEGISVTVSSASEAAVGPEVAGDVILDSPALADLLGKEIPPDAPAKVWNITEALLSDQFDGTPAGGIYLISGIFHWQLQQFDLDFSTLFSPEQLATLEYWQPPITATAPDWRPLANLWPPPSGPLDTELYLYATLTIDHLVERYGTEVLPLMIDSLRVEDSMEGWVTAVTDQSLEDFEAGWREWVIAEGKTRSGASAN
jgi:hypothetical protein